MKLQTRQEIVDGVMGEIEYKITDIPYWLLKKCETGEYTLTMHETKAKELYELLKEKFEKNNNEKIK